MGSKIDAVRRGEPSQSGRSASGGSASGPMQNLGWIPVALGAAACVAGIEGRRKGAMALALTAAVSAAAVGAVRGMPLNRGKAGSKTQDSALEIERSITISKTAEELRRFWLDPKTLTQIMAGFATVDAAGDGRMHWKVKGPLGRTYEWDAETVDRPGEEIGWRSVSGATISNEGGVRFRPAPADRGTVATLHFGFNPPGGALGAGVLELFGTTPLDLIADGVLRRFKNLVETGEIPTTVRQPAARADTH